MWFSSKPDPVVEMLQTENARLRTQNRDLQELIQKTLEGHKVERDELLNRIMVLAHPPALRAYRGDPMPSREAVAGEVNVVRPNFPGMRPGVTRPPLPQGQGPGSR